MMKRKTNLALPLLLISFMACSEEIQFLSTIEQTTLIELYSSEGCSSCPPADKFLSQFTNSNELWSNYIPIAFHVDYWDYIGWQDVFAKPEYSNRQRKHKQQQNISSVYTPGFVINGKEWSGFFKPWRVIPEFDSKPGILSVSIARHQATVHFPKADSKMKYNLAIVGSGLLTEVQSGENSGHQLAHDFVVLDHQSKTGKTTASFDLPLIIGHQPQRYALVAWVAYPNSLQAIQAVGGWLPDGKIKEI